MALTLSQKAIVAKARAVGAGRQGVALSQDACNYLLAVIAGDLGLLDRFPEIADAPAPFFGPGPLEALVLPGIDFTPLFERLVGLGPDVDTYFHCLATLHKARLKYEGILRTQPFPTVDQVGPRGLLQYGSIATKGLAAFLLWRKWVFDVDNRAAQETGYVFEPIIAAAIGGVPVGAARSPVRRRSDEGKGRQVDCVRPDGKAYEIKLRVTIAASGQGRWKEELEFPSDCKASNLHPVLIVLDPTPNPKLDELRGRFLAEGGDVHVGEDAWRHLQTQAGPTMSRFLDLYVHRPIGDLLAHAPEDPENLPTMTLAMGVGTIDVAIAGDSFVIRRDPATSERSDDEPLPDDVDESLPGP